MATLKAGEVKKPLTVEEFDALLESYRLSNPAKFEKKLASGEFDKFREKLAGKPVELEEVNPVEEVKLVEEPVEEKVKKSRKVK